MFDIDKIKAKRILIQELGFDKVTADSFLQDYPKLYNVLKKTVDKWFDDRTVGKFETLDVSIQGIMEAHGYNFLHAVKEINRLLDPDMPQDKKERMAKSVLRPILKW